MSLVIIANKTSNQEQFGRFIDELKGLIASHNSRVESGEEGSTTSGPKVDLNAFINKARELLAADNLSGLLSHILTLEGVLVNDAKSVSIFYILALLCSKITDREQQSRSVKELGEGVVNRKDVTPGTKFKLLATLFNGFGDENGLRYELFCLILSLAIEINKPSVVLTHLQNIDQYISAWNLSKDQKLHVLKLAVRLMNKCDNKLYREKYGFYSKYLRLLHKDFDAKTFHDNLDDMKVILITALNYFPYEIDISNLLDLAPIQEVAKNDKVLHDLFLTAVEGNLQDFEKWKGQHKTFLSDNRINEERVLDRVRLKSIFQEAQKNKVLKLKDIEGLLKLSEDETEFWIIKVHQEGHIRGKIDQMEGTLYIDGIIDDSFKSSEWKDLGKNLDDFRKNYEGYIEKLRSDRAK